MGVHYDKFHFTQHIINTRELYKNLYHEDDPAELARFPSPKGRAQNYDTTTKYVLGEADALLNNHAPRTLVDFGFTLCRKAGKQKAPTQHSIYPTTAPSVEDVQAYSQVIENGDAIGNEAISFLFHASHHLKTPVYTLLTTYWDALPHLGGHVPVFPTRIFCTLEATQHIKETPTYPWDTWLYDYWHELFPTITEDMTWEELRALLEGNPTNYERFLGAVRFLETTHSITREYCNTMFDEPLISQHLPDRMWPLSQVLDYVLYRNPTHHYLVNFFQGRDRLWMLGLMSRIGKNGGEKDYEYVAQLFATWFGLTPDTPLEEWVCAYLLAAEVMANTTVDNPRNLLHLFTNPTIDPHHVITMSQAEREQLFTPYTKETHTP